jgi:hypothetical protein
MGYPAVEFHSTGRPRAAVPTWAGGPGQLSLAGVFLDRLQRGSFGFWYGRDPSLRLKSGYAQDDSAGSGLALSGTGVDRTKASQNPHSLSRRTRKGDWAPGSRVSLDWTAEGGRPHMACAIPHGLCRPHMACAVPAWPVPSHMACAVPTWPVPSHMACAVPHGLCRPHMAFTRRNSAW